MHRAVFCPRCGTRLVERVPELDTRMRRMCPDCGFVAYVNPKIAAGTLPVRDGAVALVRRGVAPCAGLWTFPCGFVEIDETVEEAARRETLEESGLVVALGPMLGAYSYPVAREAEHTLTTGLLVMAWDTTSVEGALVPGDDAVDADWFDLDRVPWDELAFDSTRRALADLAARLRG